jgi:hypothetical protein
VHHVCLHHIDPHAASLLPGSSHESCQAWVLRALLRSLGEKEMQHLFTGHRISRYRFKFQSNLVWDSIKSISNFCFQFNEKSK